MYYKLGLIGFPLGHSLSPKLHEAAFRATGLSGDYGLYPIPPGDLQALQELLERLRSGFLHGLNVTIPYKQAILPFLDELSPSASMIGAVNTIYSKAGRLIGDNTDAPGFMADLVRFIAKREPYKKAIILGAGGAARAVVHALLVECWQITLAVRHSNMKQAEGIIESYKVQKSAGDLRSALLEMPDLQQLRDWAGLIVNATPVGMYPKTDFSPWPDKLPFPKNALVYDLIYNPRQTLLVGDAIAAGLQATTGIGMLVEQAALSFTCWTGRDVSRQALFAAVEA